MARRVQLLVDRGVRVPDPDSVFVSDEVDPARIAPGAILHPGTRISGATTSIGPGCVLGSEAPLTVEDCQLGRGVELKGGYVSGAVFLDGAGMGSAAHVRPGTILEEEASGAHAVGFKQTILLPFVTAGSLINFCDALMAGGTSRKDHSEIGSSYIHFNFTPHQDKATASLVGDVPRGVMLDQPPIFLGGQGGLVGPSRIGFGCVIPAGTVYRKDAPEDGMLLLAEAPAGRGAMPYRRGVYRNARRILANNLRYIGNIVALREWYRHVRAPLMTSEHGRACHAGALVQLDAILKERRKRLEEWFGKLGASASLLANDGESSARVAVEQRRIADAGASILSSLRGMEDAVTAEREVFLREGVGGDAGYPDWVRSLPAARRAAGTAWLQAIVSKAVAAAAGEVDSHG